MMTLYKVIKQCKVTRVDTSVLHFWSCFILGRNSWFQFNISFTRLFLIWGTKRRHWMSNQHCWGIDNLSNRCVKCSKSACLIRYGTTCVVQKNSLLVVAFSYFSKRFLRTKGRMLLELSALRCSIATVVLTSTIPKSRERVYFEVFRTW